MFLKKRFCSTFWGFRFSDLVFPLKFPSYYQILNIFSGYLLKFLIFFIALERKNPQHFSTFFDFCCWNISLLYLILSHTYIHTKKNSELPLIWIFLEIDIDTLHVYTFDTFREYAHTSFFSSNSYIYVNSWE